MIDERAFAVTLTIPDNEAYTALLALRRLEVPCGSLERASIYAFTVEEEDARALESALRDVETIYNPNKHRLTVLRRPAPRSGEVWIAPLVDPPALGDVRVAGRTLRGVRAIRRRTAWLLRDEGGEPASEDVLDLAVERLFCNPASERVIR